MKRCEEYDRLEANVEKILARVAHLTTMQLERFRSGDNPGCKQVDRELENAMGEKERAIGALRQHMTEHKCRGAGTK